MIILFKKIGKKMLVRKILVSKKVARKKLIQSFLVTFDKYFGSALPEA